MGIVRSNDGGLIVATTRGFEKPVNPELSFLYWDKAYFFKLDSNQNVVWDLEVFDSISESPGNSVDRLIAVDNNTAYVAAGDFIVIKSLDPPDGGRYGWIMKISDEGQLLWIRKYNIAESVGHSHQIYDLKQTSDGGFIIVGKAVGAAPDGEPTSQAWLLKLDSFGCLIPGCQANDTVSVTTTRYTVGKPNTPFSGSNTYSRSANLDRYEPFIVTDAIEVDMMQMLVTTGPVSAATVYLGMYAADDNFQPTGNVIATASVAVGTSATGNFYAQITPVALTPGAYVLGFNASQQMNYRGWQSGSIGSVYNPSTSPFVLQMWRSRTAATFTTTPTDWNSFSVDTSPFPHFVLLRWKAA